MDWTQICKESSKVVTFIDLAGHEKYLKTTVFGMTGHAPDFAMLMVGSNAGIVGMTKGTKFLETQSHRRYYSVCSLLLVMEVRSLV